MLKILMETPYMSMAMAMVCFHVDHNACRGGGRCPRPEPIMICIKFATVVFSYLWTACARALLWNTPSPIPSWMTVTRCRTEI